MAQAQPGSAAPPVPQVIPADGSRLGQLLTARAAAVAARDEAQQRLDAVNAGIKTEVAARTPDGARKITIAGSAHWPRMTMTWIRPWRLDSKRLKAEDPVTYARWAKQDPGYWDLRAADGGS